MTIRYCEIDDIKNKIEHSALLELTSIKDDGEIDEQLVTNAINEASALVAIYIKSQQKSDDDPIAPILVDISAILAISYLHRYRNIESPLWETKAKEAIAILKEIASGAITLTDYDAVESDHPTTFQARKRLFSRATLKRM